MRIAKDEARGCPQLLVDLNALRLHRGLQILKGRFNDLAQVRFLGVEARLAAHHAAHVEDVVDDLRQRAHVAHDRLRAAVSFFRGEATELEQACPAKDRVEWIAQLVTECRQEFVLQMARALRCNARSAFVREQIIRIDVLVHSHLL